MPSLVSALRRRCALLGEVPIMAAASRTPSERVGSSMRERSSAIARATGSRLLFFLGERVFLVLAIARRMTWLRGAMQCAAAMRSAANLTHHLMRYKDAINKQQRCSIERNT